MECRQSQEAERGLLGNNGQDICHAWLHSPPLTKEQGEWLVVLFSFGLSFPGTALCSTMALLSPPCFCQRLTLQTCSFCCLPFFFFVHKTKCKNLFLCCCFSLPHLPHTCICVTAPYRSITQHFSDYFTSNPIPKMLSHPPLIISSWLISVSILTAACMHACI